MEEYEIWIGEYHLGQGYDRSCNPEMIGVVNATSFKIACVIYEHQSIIDSLNSQMERGDTYIEDAHFGSWYYNPSTNSNNWTGRYFESREDALKSFKK